jgi:hypothetical protein
MSTSRLRIVSGAVIRVLIAGGTCRRVTSGVTIADRSLYLCIANATPYCPALLVRRFAFGVRCSCSCVVACRKGVSTQLEAPSRNCTPRPRGWRCFHGTGLGGFTFDSFGPVRQRLHRCAKGCGRGLCVRFSAAAGVAGRAPAKMNH